MKKFIIRNIFIWVLLLMNIISLVFMVAAIVKSNNVEKEIEIIEKIIEKEVPVEVEKEVIVYRDISELYEYKITSVERELLARLVYREARGESFDTKCGVVSVVFNRLFDGYWGRTINEVIYAAGQFSVAKSLENTTPTEACYRAVDYVLENGITIPIYVMYFRAGSFKYIPYICYEGDNTYFSFQEKDMLKHMGNKGD